MSAAAIGIGGALAIGAGISGIAGIAGSVISSNADQNAANTQATASMSAAQLQYQAAQQAAQIQQNEFNQQQTNMRPYMQAGQNALDQMQGSQFTTQPTQSQIMQYADPSMQFQMQQGEAALQASAAARGQTFSGNTLQAINNYAQNYAQTGYQNAFNNYNTAQNTVYNRLAGIAGMGMGSTQALGLAGQNYANNAGNMLVGGANAQAGGITGAANAQAAGGIGSANAWAGGLSSLGNTASSGANNWMQYSTLNNLMNKSSNNGGMGSTQWGTPSLPDAGQLGTPTFGSSLNQPATASLMNF